MANFSPVRVDYPGTLGYQTSRAAVQLAPGGGPFAESLSPRVTQHQQQTDLMDRQTDRQDNDQVTEAGTNCTLQVGTMSPLIEDLSAVPSVRLKQRWMLQLTMLSLKAITSILQATFQSSRQDFIP